MNPFNQWGGGLQRQQCQPNIRQQNPTMNHGFAPQNFQTRFRIPTELGPSSFSEVGRAGQVFGAQSLAMWQMCRQRMMAQASQNSGIFLEFQGPNPAEMCNLLNMWNQNTPPLMQRGAMPSRQGVFCKSHQQTGSPERRHIPVQVNQSRFNSQVAKRSSLGVSSGSPSSLIYVNTKNEKKNMPEMGQKTEVAFAKGHPKNSPQFASGTGHVKPVFSPTKGALTKVSSSVSNIKGEHVEGSKDGGQDEVPMLQFLKAEDGHVEEPGVESQKTKYQHVEDPSHTDLTKTDVDGKDCENLMEKNSSMDLVNVNNKPVIKVEESSEVDRLVEWSSELALDDKKSVPVFEMVDSRSRIVEQKHVSSEEMNNEANKSAKLDFDEKIDGENKELPVVVSVVFDASTHIDINSDILMNTAILHCASGSDHQPESDILMVDEEKINDDDGKVVISEESCAVSGTFEEPGSKREVHIITGQENDESMESIQMIEEKKSSLPCTEKRELKNSYLMTITGDKSHESEGTVIIIDEDDESTSLHLSTVESKEHLQGDESTSLHLSTVESKEHLQGDESASLHLSTVESKEHLQGDESTSLYLSTVESKEHFQGDESTSLHLSTVESKEHLQGDGEKDETSNYEVQTTEDGLNSLPGFGRNNDLQEIVQKHSCLSEKADVKEDDGKDDEMRGGKEKLVSGISQGTFGNSVQDEIMSQSIERKDGTMDLDVSVASEEVKNDISVSRETDSDLLMSTSDTCDEIESEVASDSLDKEFENKSFGCNISTEYTESEVSQRNTSTEDSCHSVKTSHQPYAGMEENSNCSTSDSVFQEQKSGDKIPKSINTADNVSGIECNAKDSDSAKSCDVSKMETSDLQKLCPGFSLSDKERAAMRQRARILARQMSELNQERHSSGGHKSTSSVSYMQNDETQEDDVLMSDDDDDDDLGTLPSFLASVEKIGEIPSPVTPEKSSGLIEESRSDSPVDYYSPLGPRRDFGERPPAPTKYKFSLDDLLEEKAKNEDFQRIYADLQMELQAEISKGGFAQMLNGAEEMQDDEILPEYEQQLQQFQIQESQILEQYPGECICNQQNYGRLFKENLLPRHLGYNSTKTFIDQHLTNLQPNQVRLLLTSSMLHLCFDAVSNQTLLLRWLFFVLSVHRSYPVMEGCMEQIVHILHLQQNLKKLPVTWSPTVADILSVFVNYGADLETLVPEDQAVAEIREKLVCQTEGVDGAEQQEKYSLDNLKMVLQVINIAMQGRPQYSPDDLNMMIKVLFSMALDRSQDMYVACYELQMCIASVLHLYSDDEWNKQRIRLCRLICGLSDHHHNQMYLAKLLPLGNRGSYLQKRCSFLMLRCLLLKEKDHADEILEAFQVKDLFYFLGELKNLASCDFYTLSSAISLLDMAVGNTTVKASEKDDLINLTDHIKRLTGVVKDNVRALDSTRVKDMMVRVTSKWAIFLQIHGPKQSSIFAWTRPKDSPKMTIEKVQTTCISSDEESDDNDSGEAEQVKGHKTNEKDDIFQMDDSEMENHMKLERHDTSDEDLVVDDDDDDDDGDLPEL